MGITIPQDNLYRGFPIGIISSGAASPKLQIKSGQTNTASWAAALSKSQKKKRFMEGSLLAPPTALSHSEFLRLIILTIDQSYNFLTEKCKLVVLVLTVVEIK